MSRLGPETLALFTTRRWLILSTASVLVSVTALLGARSWSQLGGLERFMLLLSISLVVLAVLLRRRAALLWLAPAGVLCLSVPALLVPTETPGWIPLPNAVANAGYLSILLVPRWAGLAVAAGNGALLSLVISRRPTNVVGPAIDIAGGSVVVVQILAASLALWWAWQLQLREARTADVDLVQREESTAHAIAQQERAQVWRTTATRVHESVLNSIRYVLSTTTVDRASLAEAVAASAPAPEPQALDTGCTVAALVSRLRSDEVVGSVVQIVGEVPATDLAPDVFAVVRAAIVELARNAVRHGAATRILVECRTEGPSTVISLTDNGSGLPADAPRGIGLGTVLGESLTDIGGTWHLDSRPGAGVVATLTIPRPVAAGRGPTPFTPFDKGRFLVTALLAGSIAVGLTYFVLWAAGGGVRGLPILLAGTVSIIGAVWLVAARRRVSLVQGLLLSAGAVAVPWLLVGQPVTCADVTNVAPAVNIAGFAVLIIATWSRLATGVVGLWSWAAGSFVVVATLPAGCGAELALALLNSLAIVPVLLGVTYAGVRGFQRAQDRAVAARQREIVEQSRAEAELELNVALHGAVRDALELLGDVAGGAPVDTSMRAALELCDMRIRAAIQVDPRTAGTFSTVARQLVEQVAALEVRLDVRSLGSSGDTRPMPAEVTDLLLEVLSARVPTAAVLQSFTTGVDDHLSIATDPSALRQAGLHDGDALTLGDVTIEVDIDAEGSDARGTALVSRSVASAAERLAPVSSR